MNLRKCDCSLRTETEINTYKVFEEIKAFLGEQVKKQIFEEIPVKDPFYTGYSILERRELQWYASKWYKCNICGCLWEFDYPDFPQKGFVKKFEDGKYIKT